MTVKTNNREYVIAMGYLRVFKRKVQGDQVVRGNCIFTLDDEEFKTNPEDLIRLGVAIADLGKELKVWKVEE